MRSTIQILSRKQLKSNLIKVKLGKEELTIVLHFGKFLNTPRNLYDIYKEVGKGQITKTIEKIVKENLCLNIPESWTDHDKIQTVCVRRLEIGQN